MAEEMRTCKTCGETKPLETGFYKNRIGDDSKVYYRHDCKRCWDKAMSERNKQRVKKNGNRGGRNAYLQNLRRNQAAGGV
ncbi:TPA: hypothetical protein ACLAV6_000089 [Neisseria meningitidis]